jgi:tol-pal system protein YbgF
MVELRRQESTTRDTLRETSNQLFEIRGDVARRLDNLEAAIERLTELVGQTQRSLTSVRDQIESQPRRGGGGGDFGGAVGGGSPADAVESYNAAVQAYNSGQFTAAVFGFQDFIEQFAGDDLVPDAYFFLGEARVQVDDREGAIDAYQQVIQMHPNSTRVPSARVGLGLTLLEQGEPEAARIQFETVITTYPDSEAATRAQEALDGMGAPAPLR